MSSTTSRDYSGRLLILEGADGTGKSTQFGLLRQRLARTGAEVVTYDFPHKGGTPIGDLIGAFLDGRYGDVTPEFLALAFSLDRLTARGKIMEDLLAGKMVVCDRYVSSNIAFQSRKLSDPVRRQKVEQLITWVEYGLLELPRPDLEVVLTADDLYFLRGSHLARDHSTQREYTQSVSDIHESAKELQVAVNAYYLGRAERPNLRHIEILDHEHRRLAVNELHEKIWDAVLPCLPERLHLSSTELSLRS